tara:strand:- start:20 stop:400 length:381 start_codon:yes stop_codon:yes gene_type:complete
MKLIEDFVERFHNDDLPSPEKCLILEDGDEIYIKKWINNGRIMGKAKDMFEWIEKKYLNNKFELQKIDPLKFKDINKRFFLKNWRMIILLCEYQLKYRYYLKAVNSVKEKSYSSMSLDEFFKLFEK